MRQTAADPTNDSTHFGPYSLLSWSQAQGRLYSSTPEQLCPSDFGLSRTHEEESSVPWFRLHKVCDRVHMSGRTRGQ